MGNLAKFLFLESLVANFFSPNEPGGGNSIFFILYGLDFPWVHGDIYGGHAFFRGCVFLFFFEHVKLFL